MVRRVSRGRATVVLAFLAALLAAFPGVAAAQATGGSDTPFRPVATVNDAAITGFDLIQRAQLLAALGTPAASPDALRDEALQQLIEDRLKEQEAKRYGITVSDEELRSGLEEFAKRLGLGSADELIARLAQRGIARQTVEDLVRAELAWRKLIRQRFAGRIEPGEAEIDAEIALRAERAGVRYRLAEIGIPAGDPQQREKARALAEDLSRRLAAGGDFTAAVRRYSRAPSAAQGGEIGWVSSAQLPPDIAEALEGLEPGQVSRPVEVPGGFSILKVLDKELEKDAAGDLNDPELRERIRNQLVQRQVARLAEGLLQELRRDAIVEIR